MGIVVTLACLLGALGMAVLVLALGRPGRSPVREPADPDRANPESTRLERLIPVLARRAREDPLDGHRWHLRERLVRRLVRLYPPAPEDERVDVAGEEHVLLEPPTDLRPREAPEDAIDPARLGRLRACLRDLHGVGG